VDLVVEDVRNEFITRETAKVVYGVVFKGDTLEVDNDATAKQRQILSP
jgi:N-methylhydantoinase B/oxoprolinase/acetone carboxylase alpha subunit